MYMYTGFLFPVCWFLCLPITFPLGSAVPSIQYKYTSVILTAPKTQMTNKLIRKETKSAIARETKKIIQQ